MIFTFPKRALILLIILLFHERATAQPFMQFRQYNTQHGLSDDYVRAIFEDSKGFIWIGTSNGLNRFDSHTFQVYKNIETDSSSLSNIKITAIKEGLHGNIWVGTWGGGLNIYSHQTDHFQRIASQPTKKNSLRTSFIYDIFRDSHGRMWIGTGGEGLALANMEELTFQYFRHDPNDTTSIGHNRITSIDEDENGKLWLGTAGGGVSHFDPETGKSVRYLYNEKKADGLINNDVIQVCYDAKHRLWVSTNDGLCMMEKDRGKFTHFKHNPADPNSLGNNQVWAMSESKEGKIWIGTENGLCLYNETLGNFYVYHQNYFDPKTVASDIIKAVFWDSQERFWVGTYDKGLSLFDKNYTNFIHYVTEPFNGKTVKNNVKSFLQLPNGKILIGSGGGIYFLDKQAARFEHGFPSIATNNINAILRDRKGRIWIGFWAAGLAQLDLEKRKSIHYTHQPDNPQSIHSNDIVHLEEDWDGKIWVATGGGGVSLFDPEKGTFENFITAENGLKDRVVLSLLCDSEGDIWIGTDNKFCLFDRASRTFTQIPVEPFGESAYAVQVLFEDSKRNIWLGLEGGGLRCMDKKTKSFKSYTVKNGFPDDNIKSIEEDENGVLWLGSNNGIIRLDPQTGKARAYGQGDGLQGLQFNRKSSAKLKSGELLFGGKNGFNLFHPDSLQERKNKNIPIVFTGFQILNRPVSIGQEDSPLSVHINETQSVTLAPNQSVFSIEYADMNFSSPEKNRYRYRLKGFVDEAWQNVGTERKATYTSLAPNTYQFEVGVVYEDGSAMPNSRSLTIIVLPPWWMTWWARLAFAFLLIGCAVGYYQYRVRNIQKINRLLEKQVTDRTSALRRANQTLTDMNYLIQEKNEEIQTQSEELAESYEEIRMINQRLEEVVEERTADLKKSNQELDNFVYRVSHDIRAPLSSLLGLMELLLLEKDHTQFKSYLEMAIRSVHKLDGFVRDILDYSRNARTNIRWEEIHFPTFFDNILEELQYMENACRLRIIKDFNLNGAFYNDPKRLHVIFRNLISNAIKYQNPYVEQPILKIQVEAISGCIAVRLEDNGIGIAANQHERVFEMFVRGSEQSVGSGIGLYIVKETVEKLGGEISLASELGSGSIFTVELPDLKPSHS